MYAAQGGVVGETVQQEVLGSFDFLKGCEGMVGSLHLDFLFLTSSHKVNSLTHHRPPPCSPLSGLPHVPPHTRPPPLYLRMRVCYGQEYLPMLSPEVFT